MWLEGNFRSSHSRWSQLWGALLVTGDGHTPPGQREHPAKRSLGCPCAGTRRRESVCWIRKEGPPHGIRGRPRQASVHLSPLVPQLHHLSSILQGFGTCQTWHLLITDPAASHSGPWHSADLFSDPMLLPLPCLLSQEWNHAICDFLNLFSFS